MFVVGTERARCTVVMPSPRHEALVMLFRNRPALVGELLRAFSVPIPNDARATLSSETLRSVQPVEISADAVVVFRDESAAAFAVIVEVQLSPDEDKLLAWPCYLSLLRRDLDCPCLLLVIALDKRVAEWAARPIPIGHPAFVLRPLVLGSDLVPRITDEATAARDVELAVLSAVAHGRETDAVAIAKTAIAAIRDIASLDGHRAAVYLDLVLEALGAAARAALEAEMSSTYEYQSDFARRYFAEGAANSLLNVLRTRGFVVDEATAARIQACKDPKQFDLWISRAVTAPSLDAVFAD